MAIHLLTARQVQAATNGDHADGGGLVLKVRASRARWLFRFTSPAGVRRAMGLGAVHRDSIAAAGRSLTAAREAADKARKLLQSGADPIDAKALERERARTAVEEKKSTAKHERDTLARVARAYHERVIEGSRSDKHAAQWIASLEANVPEELWHKPIADVTAPELLAVLRSLLGERRNRRAAAKQLFLFPLSISCRARGSAPPLNRSSRASAPALSVFRQRSCGSRAS